MPKKVIGRFSVSYLQILDEKGNVDFKPVIVLSIAGIIGSFIGTFYNSGAPESFLTIFIAVVLIFIGAILIKNGVMKNVEYIKSKTNKIFQLTSK